MQRIKEYIDICRMVWAREQPLEYHGQTVDVPLPAGEGTGLGKPLKIIKPGQEIRKDIPIWWAALKEKSVEATAAYANGWIPIFFMPEKYETVWGADLRRGLAKRDPSLGPLEITAGGMTAIDEKLTGDAQKGLLDFARDSVALYVGGMGARGKNFYNDIAVSYGYEREAKLIQDLYLDGKKKEAAAEVPSELLELSNLVGPRSYVKERIAAYKAAGVTTLQVNPVGDGVKTIETLRELVDEA
jgi:F420-dependent oxidoreductase-like protein